MTFQIDNQFCNLCSNFQSSIVFHTLKDINHNFLISYPILLNFGGSVSLVFLHLLKANYVWSGLSFKHNLKLHPLHI